MGCIAHACSAFHTYTLDYVFIRTACEVSGQFPLPVVYWSSELDGGMGILPSKLPLSYGITLDVSDRGNQEGDLRRKKGEYQRPAGEPDSTSADHTGSQE